MRRRSVCPANPQETKPIFVLLCLVVWCVVAGGTAWGGTIKGTVRFTGAAVEQKKLPVPVVSSVCGKKKNAKNIFPSRRRGIGNVWGPFKTPPPGTKGPGPCPWLR